LESLRERMFSVVWLKGKGVPIAELKQIESEVVANRAKLLREWEEKVKPDEN
jgi:hypothetical protein